MQTLPMQMIVQICVSFYDDDVILCAKTKLHELRPSENSTRVIRRKGPNRKESSIGCPLSGKSSMCMMRLKYRIILLIVIKNPWVILLTYCLLPGAAPYPTGALTAPLRTFDIPTFISASIVSPSSDYSNLP